MALCQLIKGGIDDLHISALNGLLYIGNLLRAFVDQQNDQIHLRIILCNGLCHIL